MRPLPNHLNDMARQQLGLLSARALAETGFDRRAIDLRIARKEWQRVSTNVIAVHSQPIDRRMQLQAAALHFERCGLAGSSVLEWLGMDTPHDRQIHVIGAPTGRTAPLPDVVMHTSRNCELSASPKRVAIPVAVLQAMRWARSDRQAVFYATWAIQRRLVTLERIEACAQGLAKSPGTSEMRRRLNMLEPGVHSISEFDFAQACRAHGLPTPGRQQMRTDSRGVHRYLDVEFRVGPKSLVVEIDGLHHLQTETQLDDQWRANELALQGCTVLRVPVLALRLTPDAVFEQIQRGMSELRAAA